MARPSRSRAGLLVVFAIVLYVAHGRWGDGEALPFDAAVRQVVEVPILAVSQAGSALADRVADALHRDDLKEQVRELEARLAELEVRNASLAESHRENVRLVALLGMREREGLGGRAARVVAWGPEPVRSVVVDLGSSDGIQVDAAVVAEGGLVGRVLKVGRASAVVQLVVDEASGIGAMVERSAVQGVVMGVASGCRMRYVPNREDVAVGDRILASGLDGIYPKGLAIGRVIEASAGDDAFQHLVVEPAVDLAKLETVVVLSKGEAVSRSHGPELELTALRDVP